MPITPVEEYTGVSPALTQSQPDFDINTQDALDFSLGLPASINTFIDELNAEGTILTLSTSGTSTTSNTVGAGAKTFVSQTGKGWQAGNSLVIARTSDPTTQMRGIVTSYNTGTGSLGFTSQAFDGSGTYTDWTISQGFAVTSIPEDGGVIASSLAGSAVNATAMTNGYIVASVAGNALTIAIKTLAGTDPSATDPVIVVFRNATLTNGSYVVRSVTAATSLTVPNTATLGTTNNLLAKLNALLIDNAGTVELAIQNPTGQIQLNENGVISTTAITTGSESVAGKSG